MIELISEARRRRGGAWTSEYVLTFGMSRHSITSIQALIYSYDCMEVGHSTNNQKIPIFVIPSLGGPP